MSVAKTHRRMGVAQLLMETLFENARLLADDHEAMNIFLATSELQAPAIQLYKKYGFKCFTDRSFPWCGVQVVAYFFHRSLDINTDY